MTNKESVEKARQEYKVVLSELKELLKEKPYPKEAIDNKIKGGFFITSHTYSL
jgi:hypothetical protein